MGLSLPGGFGERLTTEDTEITEESKQGNICAPQWPLWLKGFLLRLSDQRFQCLGRNTQSPAGESINVSCVYADDFTARIEDWAAAGAVRGGSVIDQLVADHVT